jgi:DNA-binding LacI/PurR family transcriptional regulator
LLERLRVAGDLSVVGFDDVPEIRSSIAPLTPSDRTATPWPSGH